MAEMTTHKVARIVLKPRRLNLCEVLSVTAFDKDGNEMDTATFFTEGEEDRIEVVQEPYKDYRGSV